MANWFVSSAGWTAVTQWAASTAYSVGDIRRQTAPTGTNHRVFRCTTAGTSGGSEPAWNLTKGSTTNDNTAVWTEITGNSTYNTTSFAAPHAWLQHAISSSWAAAGDTIYVDTSHAETQATGVTMTCVGTAASPCKIICINSTFSNPPVSGDIDTTPSASVTTTGASILILNGVYYCYGLTFNVATGATGARFEMGNARQDYEKCTFNLVHTGSQPIFLGNGANLGPTTWYNCNLSLAAAGQVLNPRGCSPFRWYGGTLSGTVPNNLFGDSSFGENVGRVEIRDVDLNSAGTWTSKYLINTQNVD